MKIMDKFITRRQRVQSANTSDHSQGIQQNEDSSSLKNLSNDSGSDELDSDSPNRKHNNIRRRKRKNKKYANTFSNCWLNVPEFEPWLKKWEEKNGIHALGYCVICKQNVTAHKRDLLKHMQSQKHQKNSQIITDKNIVKISDCFSTEKVRRAEIKLSAFKAENNLALSVMDTLAPLCKDIFDDSKITQTLAIRRTKTSAIIKGPLGGTIKNSLYNIIKQPEQFFSIIMDETTDQSSIKQCAFTVIYYDHDKFKVCCKFFDMQEMASGSANDLYKCLKNCIVDKNIPFKNLVGFSSDTTNVLFGEHHSVSTLLKKDLPHIVCVKCSCHLIHLAASEACLKLPRSIEDLLRNLGSHFSRSFARQESFKEFQLFFNCEIHKILSPAVTRWLSLKACVDRVLEQYVALQAYLRVVVLEDPSKTTDDMLNTMTHKMTRIYLEFMSHVLSLLTDFNTLFQGNSSLLHILKSEVEKLLKTLCSNYLKIDYVKKSNIFELDHKNKSMLVDYDKMYLGIQASESLRLVKKDSNYKEEIEPFYSNCFSFYITLITEVKKRFDFTDPLFNFIEIVDPNFAQNFERKSLHEIIERFPMLKDVVDIQALDDEWRKHALLDHRRYNLDPALPSHTYWGKVFQLKNHADQALFPNLQKVISFLLILPFSNANVERVFSTLKNCKTVHRNNLKTDTVVSLLLIKGAVEEEGGCVKFEPSKKMLEAKISYSK